MYYFLSNAYLTYYYHVYKYIFSNYYYSYSNYCTVLYLTTYVLYNVIYLYLNNVLTVYTTVFVIYSLWLIITITQSLYYFLLLSFVIIKYCLIVHLWCSVGQHYYYFRFNYLKITLFSCAHTQIRVCACMCSSEQYIIKLNCISLYIILCTFVFRLIFIYV